MFNPDQIKSAASREIFEKAHKARQSRIAKRRRKPVIQLADGDWNSKFRIDPFVIDAEFVWRLNDTGSCTITLPAGGDKAVENVTGWLFDPWGRPKAKNVHIRADKDGARWTGRLNSLRLTKSEDGQRTVVIEGLCDFEELRRIFVWPNPFLPAAVQFPKAWTMLAPAAWNLKIALFVNLMRLHTSLWTLPDDPLDPKSWVGGMKQSNWPIVVKPGPLLKDRTPTQLISSRMSTWAEVAEPILADCQLMVELRRWFPGDPEPWPGAELGAGTLVVDIVDKSSWWDARGTSFFGDLWRGFVRTVQTLAGNQIDTKSTVIDAPEVVPEYRRPNLLGTVPSAPYVMYRDDAITGVESSDFTWEPSTAVQVVAGGQSMPGINEGLSAAIQGIGNSLGTYILFPTAGTIADTLLAPLYSDVIGAWAQHKSVTRAQEAGKFRYQEIFAEGSNTALTLSSLVAIRKAFWDTRERFSHQIKVGDGAPWYIGDQGEGHFWLGDRIGSTVSDIPGGRAIVEQVTEVTLNIARDSFGWDITCGDFAATQSSLDTILSNIRRVSTAMKQVGVW